MNLKLADFGIATNKQIKRLSLFRGTKSYMAPELWQSKMYDGRAADVFSLGCVIFNMLYGQFPFDKATKKDKSYCHIIKRDISTFWERVDDITVSDEAKDLIIRMFHPDQKKRFTIEQVKNHPWLKKKFDHKETRQQLIDKFRPYYAKKERKQQEKENAKEVAR